MCLNTSNTSCFPSKSHFLELPWQLFLSHPLTRSLPALPLPLGSGGAVEAPVAGVEQGRAAQEPAVGLAPGTCVSNAPVSAPGGCVLLLKAGVAAARCGERNSTGCSGSASDQPELTCSSREEQGCNSVPETKSRPVCILTLPLLFGIPQQPQKILMQGASPPCRATGTPQSPSPRHQQELPSPLSSCGFPRGHQALPYPEVAAGRWDGCFGEPLARRTPGSVLVAGLARTMKALPQRSQPRPAAVQSA